MALVLSHSINDGPIHLFIGGEHVEIKLLEIKTYQVRYAIMAPDNVTILRDKVWKKQQDENGGNK